MTGPLVPFFLLLIVFRFKSVSPEKEMTLFIAFGYQVLMFFVIIFLLNKSEKFDATSINLF